MGLVDNDIHNIALPANKQSHSLGPRLFFYAVWVWGRVLGVDHVGTVTCNGMQFCHTSYLGVK